ncbi:PilN domain-containing protein [Desulfogranum japonicum]|uniref:PilN domain-containing protein n=1 Tax=Desulfogranum japonicum TaxID=231447 RepID=UPI00041C140E|nr:PilN domain-containing protein [Desulfogranum japonicum]
MILINLLPVREIQKRYAAKKQLFGYAGVFVLVLVLIGAVLYWQKGTLTDTKQNLTTLQNQLAQHQKELAEIKKLEADKETLLRQIEVIDKLKQSSSLTVHALDEVSRFVPSQRLWLESLNQNGLTLKVKGMALDNRTIAKFMDDLKSSAYIGDVALSGASMKTFAGKNLKAFEISCNLVTPSNDTEDTVVNQDVNQ